MMLVTGAEIFATAAHAAIDQRRKYTGEAYISHPRALVQLLKQNGITDEVTLAVAWLHDTIEDTKVTKKQIQRFFGHVVADHVADLTNCDKSLGNRETRRNINNKRLSTASSVAKTVKCADITHNASDVVDNDPKFAGIYLGELTETLENLVGADPTMHAIAVMAIKVARAKLDIILRG